MAQQTLNAPPVRSPFTTGDSSEKGDTPNDLVTKLTAMLTELYTKAVITPAKFVSNAVVGATTALAGELTGAAFVTARYTAVGAANLTTRTAAQMFADAGAIVGQTYELQIMNTSAGSMTLVGGTGVTVSGTATIGAGAARLFVVSFDSATTMTFQNAGSGGV